LLFLRHVERIEMYTLGESDGAPVLQFSVEVTKRDPPTGWSTVPSFVSGPPHRPLSKEAFYSKLGQTPDALLPKVEQTVTITFREERKGQGAGGVLVAESDGGAAAADADGRVKRGPTTLVDVFLVCAAIGGGGAKKMACLPEHRHMKLIPWGGVS
ncbi:unnamed protein product, partial [Hapterophycus canaliculatus]